MPLPNISTFTNAVLPSSAAGVVLAVYNARADQLSAAQQTALAQRANITARAADLATKSNRTITLQLIATADAPPAIVRPVSDGSPGTAPVIGTQSSTTNVIAGITLDIAPLGGQGFAQSLRDHSEARQTIHETAGGYYVDTFGLRPGDFALEAIVVFTRDAATQIQAFKDLLAKAKLLPNPAASQVTTPAPRLLYTNSINGRTLLLTQASLDVSESAMNPNMASIEIRASILVDYAVVTQAPAANVVGGNSAPLGGALLQTTNATGTTVNNAVATAGVQALT